MRRRPFDRFGALRRSAASPAQGTLAELWRPDAGAAVRRHCANPDRAGDRACRRAAGRPRCGGSHRPPADGGKPARVLGRCQSARRSQSKKRQPVSGGERLNTSPEEKRAELRRREPRAGRRREALERRCSPSTSPHASRIAALGTTVYRPRYARRGNSGVVGQPAGASGHGTRIGSGSRIDLNNRRAPSSRAAEGRKPKFLETEVQDRRNTERRRA